MLEAAEKLAAASPRTAVFDKKRKAELAAKLAQRWQRWELSNFDYLMQVTTHKIAHIVSVSVCYATCAHAVQLAACEKMGSG